MTTLYYFLCLLPTAWEVFDDRKGETKKGKRRDAFITLAMCLALAMLSNFMQLPWYSVAMVLVWRFLLFDYAINYVLNRNEVIHAPKWWDYSGKTAAFDKWNVWENLNWVLKAVIKVAVFIAASWVYFKY